MHRRQWTRTKRQPYPAARPSSESGRRQRRGAAIVEFAIVCPLLLMLIFGLIEVGRAVMVSQLAVNASREGARKAALTTMTLSEVETWTKNYLAGAGIPAATTTVTFRGQTTYGGFYSTLSDLTSVPSGCGIEVTVSVNFSQVSWLAPYFMRSGASISATTEMRKESA